ncbi:MAG: hypothetical protein A4E19_20920 [Nitrospira sp. SG-bin1]|nr:MAG: hypothetical protein A4E19_20920 [Nitrospira sp. SG-bin1]
MQAILDTWKENLLDPPSTPEKFVWYYQKNPLGKGQCWLLLEKDSGEFIGTAGLGLRAVEIGGRRLMVGLASDFAVKRRHRTIGPAVMLQKTLAAELGKSLPAIYVIPNKAATPIMQLCGFKKVGQLIRYVKVLNVGTYVYERFPHKSFVSMISKPIDYLMNLTSQDAWYSCPVNRVFKPMSAFDNRFDELWERARGGFRIIGERNSQFLRWRYEDCPTAKFGVFGLLDRSEQQLHAYIVSYHRGKSLNLADLFFDSPEALKAILLLFLKEMRHQGQRSVNIAMMAPTSILRVLTDIGFLPRGEARSFLVHSKMDQTMNQIMESPDNWYLLSGDNDYS